MAPQFLPIPTIVKKIKLADTRMRTVVWPVPFILRTSYFQPRHNRQFYNDQFW